MQTIKQGDTVLWRARWGAAPPVPATVEAIDFSPSGNPKGGATVEVPEIATTEKHLCIFVLDNGHWAYGQNVEAMESN